MCVFVLYVLCVCAFCVCVCACMRACVHACVMHVPVCLCKHSGLLREMGRHK